MGPWDHGSTSTRFSRSNSGFEKVTKGLVGGVQKKMVQQSMPCGPDDKIGLCRTPAVNVNPGAASVLSVVSASDEEEGGSMKGECGLTCCKQCVGHPFVEVSSILGMSISPMFCRGTQERSLAAILKGCSASPCNLHFKIQNMIRNQKYILGGLLPPPLNPQV